MSRRRSAVNRAESVNASIRGAVLNVKAPVSDILAMPQLPRRVFLLAATALAACGPAVAADPYAASPFRKLTAEDWRKRLAPESFHVLREEGTELAGTSPLNAEHRRGTFVTSSS